MRRPKKEVLENKYAFSSKYLYFKLHKIWSRSTTKLMIHEKVTLKGS